MPTRPHVPFFEDLSKLGCKTINMCNPDSRLLDAPGARTSEIIVFKMPLTKLSKVTLSECPGQYISWILLCIEESSAETLDLRFSDDILLQINEFPLSNLRSHDGPSVSRRFQRALNAIYIFQSSICEHGNQYHGSREEGDLGDRTIQRCH